MINTALVFFFSKQNIVIKTYYSMESLYDKFKPNNVNKKIDRLTANKLWNKRTKKSLNADV